MVIETEDYIQIGTWAKREEFASRETAYELIRKYSISTIEIDGRRFIKKDVQDPRKMKKGLIAPRHLVVNPHFVSILDKIQKL